MSTFTADQADEMLKLKLLVRAQLYQQFKVSTLNDAIVAGGFFSSSLNGEKANDCDVFFLAGVDPEAFMYNMSMNVLSSSYKMKSPQELSYLQNPNITAVVNDTYSITQYIFTKYKSRKELLESFDMKHCCVSYEIATDKLYITREVYDIIKAKRVVANGNQAIKPHRIEKLQKRGWTYPFTPMYGKPQTRPSSQHPHSIAWSVIDDFLSAQSR